jgi:hypothetical protein
MSHRPAIQAATCRFVSESIGSGPRDRVSHWRNRIIHRRSKAWLTSPERQVPIDESATIREAFKNLDVDELLQDFDTNEPTLKDVTVLLAMSIRFARSVDAALPTPANAAEVRKWLEAEDLLYQVIGIERESKNGREPGSSATRTVDAFARAVRRSHRPPFASDR